MKLDLASAYAASLARVASWAVVAGIIYRVAGDEAFAAFSMLRAIVTIVAVTGLGLAPALIVLLPQFKVRLTKDEPGPPVSPEVGLDYFIPRPQRPEALPDQQLLNTAFHIVFLTGVAMSIIAGVSSSVISDSVANTRFWRIFTSSLPAAVIAVAVRVFSDIAGARLQTTGRLTLDFALQAATEVLWVVLCLLALPNRFVSAENVPMALGLLILSNCIFGGVRCLFAVADQFGTHTQLFQMRYADLLVRSGIGLMFAQIADLFYGPANQAIIKGCLSSTALATYAPLLHIDAALLLGVGGLATLLLPKTAIAMGDQNHAAIRRYYVNGTLASLILLAAGASFAWAVAPKLFKVWFGDPLPATVALLPLVMIHTVIGGTAGVGRSILFGMNRAAAYTAASLIGGVANVGLAILLVTRTSLGLKGIIFATIITVVVRCAIWMPWYTLRAIRQESTKLDAERMALAAEPGLP